MGETPLIRVRLHRYVGRPYGLIWQCGQHSGEISSGTTNLTQAYKAAGRLEEQLEAGILPGRSTGLTITWKEFRERYEAEWLEGMSYGSRQGWRQAVTHFEAICGPELLSDVDKTMLSTFRGALESRKLSPASVRSYYRALRAGLGWAESVDLMDRVPSIRHRKRERAPATVRSRIIVAEEFERMLSVAPLVRPKDHAAFVRFMRGLWFTGLRIDELNRLAWEPSASLHVDLSGKLPLIVFMGAQKSGRDTYLPAPKEFWELITKPGNARTGFVFPIPGRFRPQMETRTVGRQISKMGQKANVVINAASKKCATAHDLRAAYITRVAGALKMSQTQALARHADPKTTSQFYVRHEAEELARAAGWL